MPRSNVRYHLGASVRHALVEHMVEQRAERLVHALAAACAMVAHADGQAVPAEARRMLAVIRTSPLLSAIPAEEALALFVEYARAFGANPPRARTRALRRIRRLAEEPRQARLVLNACLLVSQADGLVHPAEMAAVRQVREALGLGPDPGAVPALPPSPPRGRLGARAQLPTSGEPQRTGLPAVVVPRQGAHRQPARPVLALAG